MWAFRLTRSKTPLSTAAVLELFQKIEARLPFINYEPISELSPVSGELFIIEGLYSPITDGQAYIPSSDIFHESKFDVVIDRTKGSPKLFRFMYYNRASRYRVAHYLICDEKPAETHITTTNTPADKITSSFLEEYRFLQNIIFKKEREKEKEKEHLDSAFWKDLISRHIHNIADKP